MAATGFAVFDTALGACGIAWGPDGVVGTHLPEPDIAATRTWLSRRFPDAAEEPPPPPVQAAVEGIVALLAGAPADLTGVSLDLTGVPEFHRRVYEVARAIPPGDTLTYGEITARLGASGEAARAVGQALGANPYPIVVPCHRVVAAGGRLGGFSAPGGAATKLRLLAVERAHAEHPTTLF